MAALKHQRCANHIDREAAVRCPLCHKHFCRECITEHDGKRLCVNCLKGISGKRRTKKRVAGTAFEITVFCFALILVFLCFGYLGRRLARSGGKPLSKISTEAAKQNSGN